MSIVGSWVDRCYERWVQKTYSTDGLTSLNAAQIRPRLCSLSDLGQSTLCESLDASESDHQPLARHDRRERVLGNWLAKSCGGVMAGAPRLQVTGSPETESHKQFRGETLGTRKEIVSADASSVWHAEGLNDACSLRKTGISRRDSMALRTAPGSVRARVHNRWACTWKLKGLVSVQCTIQRT
jgi:hypothetical protein